MLSNKNCHEYNFKKSRNYEVWSGLNEMRKNNLCTYMYNSPRKIFYIDLYVCYFPDRMFLRKIKKPIVNNIYSCRKNLMKL